MQLFGALILCMTLATACGIRCYTCVATNAESCKTYVTCPSTMDRCLSVNVAGLFTKTCQTSIACVPGMGCCERDLCNSAILTGPSVILLLVSSAVITLFL